jgi:hypothetical protein
MPRSFDGRVLSWVSGLYVREGPTMLAPWGWRFGNGCLVYVWAHEGGSELTVMQVWPMKPGYSPLMYRYRVASATFGDDWSPIDEMNTPGWARGCPAVAASIPDPMRGSGGPS